MEKVYIFTREVRRWGVEAGDYYSPHRHRVHGGTEKLLQDGIIEEEKPEDEDDDEDSETDDPETLWD